MKKRPGSLPLAVIVHARNEAEQIADCLEGLRGWAADVVLADMQSEDDTVLRAEGLCDRLINLPLVHEFDATRNETAATVSQPWTLFLDADERLTGSARQTISDLVKTDDPNVCAYQLPFKVVSFGSWIQHAGNWWPSYKSPPLLRTGRFTFSGKVHDPARVNGPVVRIAPKTDDDAILHLSHRDLTHYFDKLNRYTTLEALKRRSEGSWEGAARGMGEVFGWYFDATHGKKDGVAGFFLAFGSAIYEALVHLKLMEHAGAAEVPPTAEAFLQMAAIAAGRKTSKDDSRFTRVLPTVASTVTSLPCDVGPSIESTVPGMKVVDLPGRASIRAQHSTRGLDWDGPQVVPSLSVAVTTHRHALRIMGGGEVQLLETVRSLGAEGVRAEIGIGIVRNQGELIHLFSLHHEENLATIRADGRPYVVTPIYWDRGELTWLAPRIMAMAQRSETLAALEAGFSSLSRQAEALRIDGEFTTSLPASVRQLVAGAAMVLPNAQCEAEGLQASIEIDLPNVRVIPNAAPSMRGLPTPTTGDADLPQEPFVLCAGRVEVNKNQLALCIACRILDVPLILVGAELDHEYAALCRRVAGPKARFLGPKPREQVAGLMRVAAIHALPSFAETPGLANLEAAAQGCKLVCSNRGAEKEYFGSHARYCDPLDISSIAEAIVLAMKSPPESSKRKRPVDWNQVGNLTAAAYRAVIGND